MRERECLVQVQQSATGNKFTESRHYIKLTVHFLQIVAIHFINHGDTKHFNGILERKRKFITSFSQDHSLEVLNSCRRRLSSFAGSISESSSATNFQFHGFYVEE